MSWDLVEAIVTALRSAPAAGRTYPASDGEALSTPDLLRRLARALGRDARLLRAPLRASWRGRLIGRSDEIARLTALSRWVRPASDASWDGQRRARRRTAL